MRIGLLPFFLTIGEETKVGVECDDIELNTVHCLYMIHLSFHHPQESIDDELFVWKSNLRKMGKNNKEGSNVSRHRGELKVIIIASKHT